jgi:hypothetical protein
VNFGQAIEAMKAGRYVARSGWNGRNMHIYLEDMWSFPIRDGVYKGQVRKYDPVICMFTAQGTHQPGWLASQADILAEDWEVKEIL